MSSGDELRPVAVLFADVVGSTALAERLPPDEAKTLIGECVSQMSRAVHEYGGIVQAYMGDGICAYFGVPAAREDDPERAARAALRILEVVSDYARDVERAWGIEQFAVRVGINAGPAAVGLVGGVDDRRWRSATRRRAARLQSLAAPGTVVVGEEAARRLAHRFGLDPLGSSPFAADEAGRGAAARRASAARTTRRGARPPCVGRGGRGWSSCARRPPSSRQGTDRCCS